MDKKTVESENYVYIQQYKPTAWHIIRAVRTDEYYNDRLASTGMNWTTLKKVRTLKKAIQWGVDNNVAIHHIEDRKLRCIVGAC